MLARYLVSSCLCLSKCSSVTKNGIISKQLDESSWFLAWSLPSHFHYPTLCCKDIKVSKKIKVLSSVTLFQTLDLQKFCREVDGFVNKTLRRSSLLTTPTTVDASQAHGWAHEVYYTSVDRNTLTPLFRLMVDLLCNLFLQGYSSWQHLDWQRVARSLCGAQLLVLSTVRDPSKTQTIQVGSLKLCKMWQIHKSHKNRDCLMLC